MKLTATGTLQRLQLRLARIFSSKVLILLYHRVRTAPCFDPYVLGVTPEHFGEHLEVLLKHGRPMHLRQVVEALRHDALPRRAVVVTFDDGYADNLHNAKPILERFDFPATVFVTAGYVGQQNEFWWDELERTVLHAGSLPSLLQLEIDGRTYEWNLGDGGRYSEADFQLNSDWHYGLDVDPSPRHRLFRSLYQILNSLSISSRQGAFEKLRAWARMELNARATHRILTPAEVVELAEEGLVEIGAHTVNHPALGSLPPTAQREEIQGSKTRLEEILGMQVASFAYPYGSRARSDYTEQTVALVQAAGFASACSNLAQPVYPDADPFQLSRAGVKDWDGDELASRLATWLRR